MQFDELTQQNAALVERSAASQATPSRRAS
jgi:hypothetical protein